MIEAKKKANIINKSDYDVIDQLFKRIEKADISLDILKTDLFFKPEKLMKVKEQIDDLLLLFSYAFFPSRIRWDSFSSNSITICLGINSSSSCFVTAPSKNLFNKSFSLSNIGE